MRPGEQALALAHVYRLAIAHAVSRSSPGEKLSNGTGSSLEFQDRRYYAPGDDVRHLDWRVFARTEELFVRLHREEVSPRIELLVDGSRSMAVADDKARLATDLAALLASAGRGEGLEVRTFWMDDRPHLLDRDHFEREGAEFDGGQSLLELLPLLQSRLRRGAIRLVVSDFLFPHDPVALVRSLARDAGSLALIQVLGRTDLEPEAGAVRLRDAERAGELDLVLGAPAIASYQRKLQALTRGLAEECRRIGASFCELPAKEELGALCRDRLVPARVLTPA